VRLAVALLALLAGAAHADPTGAHPRLLVEPGLRAAWREQASAPHGPVHGAIALCDEARTTHEHDRALYQGAEWAKVVQACLVAWAATDSADHGATAVRFFTALLDDLDTIGDHRGGDEAARRDDGYAIRNLGPYTALAYDWLHDAPGMTPELRAHARARWKAWLAWHRAHGYRVHTAATNYHAGYALAATLIAIAEAGEAGDDGAALWREVNAMWTNELGGALADGGVLEGGDWPEGWQYGPLSVAELALGARVMKRAGVEVPGIARWLGAVLRRHVHGLSPGGGVSPGATPRPKRRTCRRACSCSTPSRSAMRSPTTAGGRAESCHGSAWPTMTSCSTTRSQASAIGRWCRRARHGRPPTSPAVPAPSTRARAGTIARSGWSRRATVRSTSTIVTPTPETSCCRAARTTSSSILHRTVRYRR
jgi:hypothetical protein